MRVLITGGTGFIGSRLALRHVTEGHDVQVVGQANTQPEIQNSELLRAGGVRVTFASVTDADRFGSLLRGVDVVYHLAAAQHETNVPDQHFWDVNVTGTENVLKASGRAGVKRFVHGSTIGVYGAALQGQLDEHSPLQPDNIYGVTKLAGEQRALAFQEQLPVVIIRIAETFGPGDYRLLKLFTGIKKRVFVMIGDGRNRHHPIYIDDLLDGFLLAGVAPEAVGQVFVLAGKEIVTTYDMVTAIARQLGTSLRRFHLPLPVLTAIAAGTERVCRPFGIRPPLHRRRLDFFRKSFAFSATQAHRRLGFAPRVSFQTGVEETARWYRRLGYL